MHLLKLTKPLLVFLKKNLHVWCRVVEKKKKKFKNVIHYIKLPIILHKKNTNTPATNIKCQLQGF